MKLMTKQEHNTMQTKQNQHQQRRRIQMKLLLFICNSCLLVSSSSSPSSSSSYYQQYNPQQQYQQSSQYQSSFPPPPPPGDDDPNNNNENQWVDTDMGQTPAQYDDWSTQTGADTYTTSAPPPDGMMNYNEEEEKETTYASSFDFSTGVEEALDEEEEDKSKENGEEQQQNNDDKDVNEENEYDNESFPRRRFSSRGNDPEMRRRPPPPRRRFDDDGDDFDMRRRSPPPSRRRFDDFSDDEEDYGRRRRAPPRRRDEESDDDDFLLRGDSKRRGGGGGDEEEESNPKKKRSLFSLGRNKKDDKEDIREDDDRRRRGPPPPSQQRPIRPPDRRPLDRNSRPPPGFGPGRPALGRPGPGGRPDLGRPDRDRRPPDDEDDASTTSTPKNTAAATASVNIVNTEKTPIHYRFQSNEGDDDEESDYDDDGRRRRRRNENSESPRKDAVTQYMSTKRGSVSVRMSSAFVGFSMGGFLGKSIMNNPKPLSQILCILFFLMGFLRNDYGELSRALGLALILTIRRTTNVRKRYPTAPHLKALLRAGQRKPFPPLDGDDEKENPWRYQPVYNDDPDFRMPYALIAMVLVGSIAGGNIHLPLFPAWIGGIGGAALLAFLTVSTGSSRGDLARAMGMRVVSLAEEALNINKDLRVFRKVGTVSGLIFDKILIIDRKHRVKDRIIQGFTWIYDKASNTAAQVQADIKEQ